jgi:hypothetical protein
MIGGDDVVIPRVGDNPTLEACLRIVHRKWPHSRFEDALTGEKYSSGDDIPLGHVREVLVYSDAKAEAEAEWDADRPDAPTNSMLYLILSDDSMTVVMDDANAADMRAIVGSLREI